MISSIVSAINTSLIQLGGVSYGISTPTLTEDAEGKLTIIPVEVKRDLSCKHPDLEDKNKITVYHRIIRKQYSKNTRGYGDGNGMIVSYEMRLVCFGMRRKVNATPEEVEQNVVAMLPEKVGKTSIEVIQSDFDQNRLFTEEFSNVDNFISTDSFLFAVAYKATLPYNSTKCLPKTY